MRTVSPARGQILDQKPPLDLQMRVHERTLFRDFSRRSGLTFLGLLGPRHTFQRRFRRTGKHLPSRFKTRPMTGTVPSPVGSVPPDDAAQVRADWRKESHFSILIAVDSNLLSSHLHDLPLSKFQLVR